MTALTDGWVGRRRFDVLQSEESATNFILLEVYNSQDGELVTRRSTLLTHHGIARNQHISWPSSLGMV